MFLIELAIGLSAIAVYVLARRTAHARLLMADAVFAGIAMFFIGAWVEARRLDYIEGSEVVLHLALLALVSATASGILLRPMFAGVPPDEPPTHRFDPRFLHASGWFVVAFNLMFAAFVYQVLLGGNLARLGDERGLLVVRKMISSGEKGYFFPGLVKQVRDVLAPTLMIAFMAYTARGSFRVLTLAVAGTTLLAMFLGGQRGPLLALGWSVYIGWRHSAAGQHHSVRTKLWTIGLVVAAVPMLGIVNVMLGRVAEGASVDQVLFGTIGGVFERLFLIVPRTSIEAFAFIESRDFGFGELWITDLAILAPGTQAGLSNELHNYLGGSMEGNAVLGLPVNSYVNAGYAGVILTPLIYMFAATFLDRRIVAMRDPLLNCARQVVLVYLIFAFDPYLFLLTGGLFLLFCLGLATVRPRGVFRE